MLTGVDTGFFFALGERNPLAVDVWKEGREIVTSAVVLYELQKKLLQGQLKSWTTVIADIEKAVEVISLTPRIALRAGHLAHGTCMPGLDALILGSLLVAECREIYTTDSHLAAYQKKGLKIINLSS
jgi:predicted nucleic acid-binding protein